MNKSDFLIKPVAGDLLANWKLCGGFYECPKDASGQRLGPLVGYAKQYEPGKHFVGEVYYNFARVEQQPFMLAEFVRALALTIRDTYGDIDLVVGAPMGGIGLAMALSLALPCVFAYLEKETVEAQVQGQRATSKLVVNRHDLPRGARALLIEDVVNNLSTPDEAIPLLEQQEVETIGIACALSRAKVRQYHHHSREIPITSVIYKPEPQYRQDDPFVANDIAAGKIVWKPKDQWASLAAAG